MPTFTTRIQLHLADVSDLSYFNRELEAGARTSDQQVHPRPSYSEGESVHVWEGDVSIQKIAGTIFRAAPKTKKKFSFTIMKNK